MTVAILCTRRNRSKIRIYFERNVLIMPYVNEVSCTYQIYVFNVNVITTYYKLSLKNISLSTLKIAAYFYENNLNSNFLLPICPASFA